MRLEVANIKRFWCLLSVACLSALFTAGAQELNCTVEVNADQIQNSSKEVFETLEQAIAEYVNTNKWTNAQFAANEKIECRMFFTIKSYDGDKMTGELQVQSRRPVYNSSYTTTLINFKDTQVEFNYQEYEPLVFSETSIESNLTAVINFYVYMILGVDFDSFSPMGGTPFYELARQVVNLGQSSMETGWKAFEDNRNRHALLSAFVEQSTAGFRQLWYDYHRGGLDEMALSVDKGRAKITESLQQLQKVYEASPMSVVITLFRDAKLDELVNVYSKAPTSEKETVYDILTGMYPTDRTILDKIKQTE